MNNLEKIRYLSRPEGQHLLQQIQMASLDRGFTYSKLPQLKSLKSSQRIAIMEQLELRQKALAKFHFAGQLLFTRLNLQQSTQDALGRYKASKIGTGFSGAADLCCGLGGDSFQLKIPVIGVDKDAAAIAMYQYNMRMMNRSFLAVHGDVEKFRPRVPLALLDPARRSQVYSGHWDDSRMTPGMEVIESLLAHYDAMVIKLSPATPLREPFLSGEMEYIGLRDQCLELSVWLGDFSCEKGCVRATELPSGDTLVLHHQDIPDSFSTPRSPGQYIYEPVKCVVRSHLFGLLCQQHGLWQLDESLAYLSGNNLIKRPLLKPYRIKKILPFNFRTVLKELQSRDVGIVTVKKRGVKETPEFLSNKLKLKGSQHAVLILTRVKGLKTIFLVEPV